MRKATVATLAAVGAVAAAPATATASATSSPVYCIPPHSAQGAATTDANGAAAALAALTHPSTVGGRSSLTLPLAVPGWSTLTLEAVNVTIAGRTESVGVSFTFESKPGC